MLKPAEEHFWRRYLSTLREPAQLANAQVSASVAGDERTADLLLKLYLDGKKTAGSSLLKEYEATGEALPTPGIFWMILDSTGRPRCIVKTTRVETHSFERVPAAVAIAEGEGDLSLEFWRAEHVGFFEPYLAKLKIKDLSQEKIVTEFFEVVFKD